MMHTLQMKGRQKMATEGVDKGVETQQLLKDFEEGRVEISGLPEDLRKQVIESLQGDAADTPQISEESHEEQKGEEEAAKPAEKPPEDLSKQSKKESLNERLKRVEAEKNTASQKLQAREKLLKKLGENQDFAILYLQERGISLVPGSDPKVEARLHEIRQEKSDSSSNLAHEEKELHQELFTQISSFTDDLGESYESANQKWTQVWKAVNGDTEKAERVINDPEFRKSLGLEIPVNPEKYFKATHAVKDWESMKGKYPLDMFLSQNGLAQKASLAHKASSSKEDDAERARIERAAQRTEEVPVMPTGSVDSISAQGSQERFDRLMAKADKYGNSSLSPEESKFVMECLGAGM